MRKREGEGVEGKEKESGRDSQRDNIERKKGWRKIEREETEKRRERH